MRVVIASSEVVPFAKTGGLADVTGALPKQIKSLRHDVITVMPYYKDIKNGKFKVVEECSFSIPVHNASKKVTVYKGTIPKSGGSVYFIGCDEYFDRKDLYQKDGVDYEDNAERFSLFSRSVLELCKMIGFQPDNIHCNDWQTGLIPVYLKTLYADDSFFSNTSTLFTIHNLAYQGNFVAENAISASGLPWDVYSYDKCEFWGKFSFIKAGLVYSDVLSTVSDKYSKEIQTTEFGCGLEGLLASRAADLFGIVNGLDYGVWDPKKDKKIPANYNVSDLAGKKECKQSLLKKYGLKYSKKTPVIGVISRLADQKGFDLIEQIIDEVLGKKVQFVLLGTGDQKYHELFASIAEKYPDKAGVELKYDANLAQLIYAGVDMFLMPSQYEPCGLGQLISLKYGSIPIVRETGGLADTIVDYDLADVFEADKSNGFVFKDYDAAALLERINRSISIFSDTGKWEKLMKNAMRADFSWKSSSKRYEELYALAYSKK